MDGIAASTRDQFLQALQHTWIFHSGTPCHGEANISSCAFVPTTGQTNAVEKTSHYVDSNQLLDTRLVEPILVCAFAPIMFEMRNCKEKLFV